MPFPNDSPAPKVLFIGGHDPSGGAGLQADTETAARLGCRAISLVTCLTAQNSRNVQAIFPQDTKHLSQQAETLLADIRPVMVKIGLLGDANIATVCADLVQALKAPLVFDPVLAAGGGTDLADPALLNVIREHLLPLTTLLTPNRGEARRLAKTESMQEVPQRLLELGSEHLLITGADEADSGQVVNRLHGNGQTTDFAWPMLPHTYHGSGCTLAAACACELALGRPVEQAVHNAQHFTWRALEHAEQVGGGQRFPNRRSIF